MTPKIKKILYATDLSENSGFAFRYAVDSAVQHDAELHILHVLEVRSLPFLIGDGAETAPEVRRYLEKLEKIQKEDLERKTGAKENIRKRLEDFCKRELQGDTSLLKRIGPVEIVEGDPAAQILRKAEELPADQLIMGTHGKGWLSHAFLGSVAESVLHRIKIPVLIIPLYKKKDGL